MVGAGTHELENVCDLITSEYQEMPGLCLTMTQMRRLWNLGPSLCHAAVRELLSKGVLRQNSRRQFLFVRDRPRNGTLAAMPVQENVNANHQ